MINFLIIYLNGFLWLTRDIIRVPETFNDSYFKHFKGHKYIDPQMSWKNQYIAGKWLSYVISIFSDLFHTLGTVIILTFLSLRFIEMTASFTFNTIVGFACFGAGAFTAQWLWREKLNKKITMKKPTDPPPTITV
jgi:hypothetical protein